jgi:hypothetical protein
MSFSDEERVAKVENLVASIEELILNETGQHVLRSGYDGSFTPQGGKIARLIDEALQGRP